MESPEPILPEFNALPTLLWIGIVVMVVALSVLHAVRRQRGAWVVGMVLVPPFAIVAYWAVELLQSSGWRHERQATE